MATSACPLNAAAESTSINLEELPVSPLDMAAIATTWQLHDVQFIGPLDMQGFGSQGTFRLATREGEFVLKIASAGQTTADLAEQLALLVHLNELGYPHAPALLRVAGGEVCAEVRAGVAYIYSYVAGNVPRHTAENDARLAEALAALHAISGFERAVRWTPEQVVGHIIHDRVPHLPPPLQGPVVRLTETLHGLDRLPHCPIHGDISLDNTLLTPDDRLTIIDWDGAGKGVRLLDAAKPLFEFVSPALTFDYVRAAAFYQAYLRHVELTSAEWDRTVDMALLLPLNYILYGDPEQRLRRIQWLHEHREVLTRWLMTISTSLL